MKKLFILVSALATLAACQKEVTRDGSAPVQIRISTGAEVGGAMTRANNYSDEAVVRVDVLVFDNSEATSGGDHLDAKLVETRYAYKKSGSTDLYSTTLKAGADLDIYFAINAEAIITAANLVVGTDTWATVQKKLIMTPADMIDRAEYGLPMWGYRYGETISSGSEGNNFGTVYMTRAIASADVTIAAAVNNFELIEGSVEYAVDKGYLAYLVDEDYFRIAEGATGGPLNIDKPQMHYWLTEPQIPTGATTGVSPADFRVVRALDTDEESPTYDNNKLLDELYFFENDGPGTSSSPTGRKYSKVVLKGIWDDPDVLVDTKETYYPLAFRDRDENEENINERVEIIRNRKFIFTISKVNGHGYPTLEEAKQGEDLNMQYEVIPWDEWEDTELVVGSDSRWVSISPSRNKTEIKQASLYRNATSTDEIAFTTNYDPKEFTLSLEDGETITLSEAEKNAGIIARVQSEAYTIDLVYVGTNSDGEAQGKFIFTARKDYTANPQPNEAILTVANPYVKFTLKVDQENSSPEDWKDGGDQIVEW
jgi:hypothetical protein